MANKGKVRDSNMELLRLLAMFLVLVVHANFRALPRPDSLQIATNTTSALLQFMTEGFAIVAVDVFVLLSGWYGIKMKFSRLAEMGFQILFFGLLGIGICAVYDPANMAATGLLRAMWCCLCLLRSLTRLSVVPTAKHSETC